MLWYIWEVWAPEQPVLLCTHLVDISIVGYPFCAVYVLQTFPIDSTVYIIGGLTNAEELPGGNMTGPPEPVVLKANVAYNTYTQLSTPRSNMPEPR